MVTKSVEPNTKALVVFQILFRWAAFGFAFLATVFNLNSSLPSLLAYILLAVVSAYNLAFTLVYPRLQKNHPLHRIFLGFDVLFSVVLVSLTGIWRSPYLFYGFSPILTGSLFYSMKELNRLKEENERLDKLASLYDNFQTVNPNSSVGEILGLVADCAKKLTQTEKIVLSLIDQETVGFKLDAKTMVVRGSQAQHPESFWKKRVQDVTEVLLEKGGPIVIPETEFADAQSSILCFPLKAQNKSLGILSAINSTSSHLDDNKVEMLGILAKVGGAAVENARLLERNQQLLLERERGRIAQNIHDGLAQSLYSIVLNLEICSKALHTVDPPNIKEKLVQVQTLASRCLKEIRQYIYDLSGPDLTKGGFVAMLNDFIKEFQESYRIPVDFVLSGEEDILSGVVDENLYHIFREALGNVLKHAQASHISVGLEFDKDKVLLKIKDNGKGLDVNKALLAAKKMGRMGLINMSARAKTLGGNCIIKSTPGLGTEISIMVPK